MPAVDLPGVFLGSHAVAAGRITTRQLRQLSFRRLTAGVYADPGLPDDHRLRCRGVGLVLPPGTAIGGHSAAAWHGAPHAARADAVTVLRPGDVRWGGRRGVSVHRSDLRRDDIESRDDVPVTTALRTAWDVAVLESLTTSVAALDAMLRAGTVQRPQLLELVESSVARWGVTRVRRVLELVDARAESPAESWVRVTMVLAGLSPVPQFEVRCGGEFVARVDLGWPEERVALEYEGAHHFVDGQIARDDVRLARLEAAGWIVIRVSAADLRQLDDVARRVRIALLARRL